jgi:RNA polymerase sigma factor (sigma-70 family)
LSSYAGESTAVAEASWPDHQLIAAAQSGDVASMTALVSGSHPNVRRFARSLCATPEDAEDAAQEALIILYRKIGMLRASGALASWMFRIVRNECLRRARAVRAHAPVPDEALPDAAVGSAEEVVLQRIEAAEVAAAIAALPTEQRLVLILRDVQGHSGRAVCEALDLTTAAMKSRLHRARTAVQKSLSAPSEPVCGDSHAHT